MYLSVQLIRLFLYYVIEDKNRDYIKRLLDFSEPLLLMD